jgi:hypothetical protein
MRQTPVKILSLHERFDELDELKGGGIDSKETHSMLTQLMNDQNSNSP